MPIDCILSARKMSGSEPPPSASSHPTTPATFVVEEPSCYEDLHSHITHNTPQEVILAGKYAQASRMEVDHPRPEGNPTPVFLVDSNSRDLIYYGEFPSTVDVTTLTEPTPPIDHEDDPDPFRAPPSPFETASSPTVSFETASSPTVSSEAAVPTTPLSSPEIPVQLVAVVDSEKARRSIISGQWKEAFRCASTYFSKGAPMAPPSPTKFEDTTDALSEVSEWGSAGQRNLQLDPRDNFEDGDEARYTQSGAETEETTEDVTDPPAWDVAMLPLSTDSLDYLNYENTTFGTVETRAMTITEWVSSTALHLPPATLSIDDTSAKRFSGTRAKIGKPLRRILSLRSSTGSTATSKNRDPVDGSEASFGLPEHYAHRQRPTESRDPSPLATVTVQGQSAESDTCIATPSPTQYPGMARFSNDTVAPSPIPSPAQARLTLPPGPVSHLQLEVMFATQPRTYSTPHFSAVTVDFSTTPNWLHHSPDRTVERVRLVWEELRTAVSQLHGETFRLAYIPLAESDSLSVLTAGATTLPSPIESCSDPTPRLTRRLSCRAMSTIELPSPPITPTENSSTPSRQSPERLESPLPALAGGPALFSWKILLHRSHLPYRPRFVSSWDVELSVVDEVDSAPLSPRSSMSTTLAVPAFDPDGDEANTRVDDDHEGLTIGHAPQIHPPQPRLVLDDGEDESAIPQVEPWGAITSMLDTFARFALEAQIADTHLVGMTHGKEPFHLITATNPATDRIVFLALMTSLARTILDSFPPGCFSGPDGRRLRTIVAAFVKAMNVLFEPFSKTQGVIKHFDTRRISRLVNGGMKMRLFGPTMRRSDFLRGVEGAAPDADEHVV